MAKMAMELYKLYGKRIFDFIVSLVALIILFPLILILYIAVSIKLGKPCLFKQNRPGLNGKIFTLYKFRTMKNSVDNNQKLLPDADRITPFGKFLRKTSLDELPELLNVVKGDMSLVGPRPLLIEYLPLYSTEQARRHLVKPGLTGWAQINGRNSVEWNQKFKLDTWYVDHLSFLLDLKILFQTIIVVFDQDGINAKDHVSMPNFTGNN